MKRRIRAKPKAVISRPSVPKYRQLLIALVANLVIAPFLSGLVGIIIAASLFFYAIFAVIKSLDLPTVFFRFYVGVALIAFVLQIAGNLGWFEFSLTPLTFFAQGIYSVYLGVAIALIFREIYTATRITVNTIQGGICIYLMLGLLWALFYGMTSTLDPDAFTQTLFVRGGGYTQVTYFSFTTLTTLGYGDITPVSELAQVLTNVEAIIGQLYPSIFIALLVGGYLSQRSDED